MKYVLQLVFIFVCRSSFADYGDIEAVMQLQVKNNLIPGASIGFYDNQNVKFYNYGVKKIGEPAVPNSETLYEIGSLSKIFTGIILAGLHNANIVSLQDPIAKYVPELLIYPAGRIKLIELSTHASGLPRLPSNMRPSDRLNPYKDYDEALLMDYLKSLPADFKPQPFSWKNYSNLGVGLLGYVLTRATNKSYEKLLHEYVTLPLGMADTVVTLNDERRARFAVPYSGIFDEVLPWDLNVLVGAGGIRSSTRDMMSFIQANLNPDNFRIGENLKLAQQVQAYNENEKIGLGWGIGAIDGSPFLNHNGGTGGFRSKIVLAPGLKKGIIILTNSENEVQCAATIFLTEKGCSPDFGAAVPEAALDSYVGEYVSTAPALTFVITRRLNFLVYEIPGQEKGRLKADSETQFNIQNVATLEFKKSDQTGLVDRVHFKQGNVEIDLVKK